MINLTQEDWAEIYYALETKSLVIRQGRYDPADSPGQNIAWIAHLDALLEKIGPDGSSAAHEGTTVLR
jgi:hypothetical protein